MATPLWSPAMTLQLPTKAPASLPPAPPPVAAQAAVPMGAKIDPALMPAPAVAPKEEEESKTTRVDELMDAVGMGGVDLGAEEEGLRRVVPQPTPLGHDRSRKQDFIDPQVLAEAVKKIAAAFQLKTLEPDTIPLIALATRHRLSSLITSSISARDHRRTATHLRPPPLTSRKGKRKRSSYDDDDDDFDDDEDDEALGEGADQEGWDAVVFDEPEKLLGVLERVDREQERRKRRERMLRDQKDEQERLVLEATKASLAAADGAPSDAATPREGEEGAKPAKKKKKELNATQAAKNMSEDVKKKLTDQTAIRSLGGRNFSWLNAGASTSTPIKPIAALSSSTTGTPGPPLAETDELVRLSNVPPLHDRNRQEQEQAEWAQGMKLVEMQDLVWAMETERGAGVGRGTGMLVGVKARAGIINNALRKPK